MNINSSALRTGYAEKREAKPMVALIDNFRDADTTTAHGEITESVLLTHGKLKDEDVQNYHGESGAPFSPEKVLHSSAQEVVKNYDTFVTGATVSFLDMVSDNLEQILTEQPSIRVISQSQSQTPARLAEPFLGAVQNDADFRARLAEGLELKSDSPADVMTAVLAHTESMLGSQEVVGEAKLRYQEASKRAFDNGVVSVIAGGNQGSLAAALKDQGVTTSPSAFRSFLVNDFVTVVGASTREGAIADLNSPGGAAEVYALGEQVPVHVDGQNLAADGTSVATPLVAGRAVEILKTRPEMTPFQVENELLGIDGYQVAQGQSVAIDGERELKGDGTVDEWISAEFGTGILSGINDPDVPQFLESKSNIRLGLPGDVETSFQIVSARNSGTGRNFTLSTFFGENRHVIEGYYENGAFVSDSITEAVFLKRPEENLPV